jgi:allophanate hydrolase subunit 2
MATVDMATLAGTTYPSRWSGGVRTPYMVEVEVDLAEVVTAKGSAIAQGDVIEVIDLPAGTMILAGGVQVTEAMTGTSTDATIDVGVTGGDVDNLVDGLDLDGAAAGAYAATGVNEPVIVASADTIDILVVTQTGSITGGKVRVFAVLLDVSAKSTPGLAALGS